MTRKLAFFASTIALCALTACTSDSSDSSDGSSTASPAAPTVAAACTASSAWSPVPLNFSATQVGERLGVAESEVRNGSYGPAQCDQAVLTDDINSPQAPFVSVKGQGSKCLAVGTQDRPVPGGSTDQILAVCPKPTDPSAV